MSRYISRKCPKCRDYFGVTLNQLSSQMREIAINAFCTLCGYQLKMMAIDTWAQTNGPRVLRKDTKGVQLMARYLSSQSLSLL